MDNQIIAKRYKTELSSVKDLLFKFLLGWTTVLLAFSWLDFFIPHLAVSEAMVTSYLILLGVYIWWISLLTMLIISFFTKLEVSPPIRYLSYEVLGAFLLSEVSKSINAYKRAASREE